ncbi:nitric-oxide reductase large subunit [Halomarina ordinaria]|uniref:Cbb3-type cytochrome c oxidase subunit I n=1 Tax=Halomarina ordinaria TaxID=3033939 RepID=A0ABD5UEQ3_9EURY|nr:cbb3-type cytochrome c oxidase subunit I [Halomarina sp. PSRA2]
MPLGPVFTHSHPSDETTPSTESNSIFATGVRKARTVSHRIKDRATDGVAAVENGADQVKQTVADEARRNALERIERRLERAVADYPSVDERADRRLDAFLSRYALERAQLDERTVDRLRRRFRHEEPTLAEELLNSLTTDRSTEPVDANEGGEQLTETVEQFCEDAAVDSDQSLRGIVDDLVQQDVITLGTAIESLVDSLDAGSLGAHPGTAESDRETERVSPAGQVRPPSADTASPDGLSPVATVAVLSTIFLAGERAGDGGGSVLPNVGTAVPGLDTEVTTVLSVLERVSSFDRGGTTLRPSGSKALVGLFVANLVAMSVGAWLSRTHAPPIPEEIRGPDGDRLVSAAGIKLGKKAFQANGLMNHGSVLGNGSYFGSDLTADALSAKVDHMREYYADERGADSFDDLDSDEQAIVARRVEDELDSELESEALVTYSAAEAYAHRQLRAEYVDRYYRGRPEHGIPEGAVESPEQAERLADFAAWTAWFAHTNRPGSEHSFTNDWPYTPGSGNRPTGQVLGWSTISLVLLIAGGGLGVWAYHSLDFAEPATDAVDVPHPDSVATTPTQHVAAWYVPVAGVLFLAQVFAGAMLAHYYVERDDFYRIGERFDIDVLSVLPFSVVRTYHVNLGVLWITLLWLAGGLFLPGLFSDSDPAGQSLGAAVLLVALVVTTVGAFTGAWLGIQGKLGSPEDGDRWWLLGAEGLEYLETGRVWKVLLLAGLAGWSGLVLRGARRVDESPVGLGHFMTYAGGSIALLFGASMLYTPETNIAVTEFWRWWVVHMWVEGVFEFFVTAVTAIALVSMDLLDKTSAEQAIMFEVFAIMGAGIVGVSHHYWWVGLPDFWVPLGTTFSTLEFVPLMFILHQSLEEYQTLQAQTEAFPYTLPLLFILGSSLWNFVGGGVLGFFINIPAINYFEHGTYLTVAHAHTATFGAFGLLALGLGTYILRVVTPEAAWEPGWFRATFWLTNIGLIVMTVASLLPLGFSQLRAVYAEGYDAARSPEFYERPRNKRLLWARSLGDTPMILGAAAFTLGAVKHLLAARKEAGKRPENELSIHS